MVLILNLLQKLSFAAYKQNKKKCKFNQIIAHSREFKNINASKMQ